MAKTASRERFALHTFDETSHGYTTTHVHILRGTVEPIADRIVGCIDNRAGYYGGIDTAMTIQRTLLELQATGVTQLFCKAYGEQLAVKYQHYVTPEGLRNGYCGPSVDLGSDPWYMRATIPIFQKLCKLQGGFPDTPEALMAAFPKALRIAYVGSSYQWYVLPEASRAIAAE